MTAKTTEMKDRAKRSAVYGRVREYSYSPQHVSDKTGARKADETHSMNSDQLIGDGAPPFLENIGRKGEIERDGIPSIFCDRHGVKGTSSVG